MKRQCMICGKELHACMGSVIAGDWLKLVTAGILVTVPVRELCGKCVFKAELAEPELASD